MSAERRRIGWAARHSDLRKTMKRLGVLLVLVVACVSPQSEPDERPNVLLILVDDLGVECLSS